MKTKKVAERLVWAVETLAVEPDDRLLEIGCGHGVAVSLVCEHLVDGTVTAIDRSEAMVRAARKRNREHIASGKAVLRTGALEELDFGGERFDKIFAINVGLFRGEAARDSGIIKRLLSPEGALYLFHQPPIERKTREFADATNNMLRENGLSIREILFKKLESASAACVIATEPL